MSNQKTWEEIDKQAYHLIPRENESYILDLKKPVEIEKGSYLVPLTTNGLKLTLWHSQLIAIAKLRQNPKQETIEITFRRNDDGKLEPVVLSK